MLCAIPHGTVLLQLDVELMARYQSSKTVTKRRQEFAALMDFIRQQTISHSARFHEIPPVQECGLLERVNVAETMLKMRATIAPGLSKRLRPPARPRQAGSPGKPQYLKNEAGARFPYRWNRSSSI